MEKVKSFLKAHWKWVVPLVIGVAATAYFALRKTKGGATARRLPAVGGGGGDGGGAGSTQGAGSNLGPAARPLVAPPMGKTFAPEPYIGLPRAKAVQAVVGAPAPRPTAPPIPNLTDIGVQSAPAPVSFSRVNQAQLFSKNVTPGNPPDSVVGILPLVSFTKPPPKPVVTKITQQKTAPLPGGGKPTSTAPASIITLPSGEEVSTGRLRRKWDALAGPNGPVTPFAAPITTFYGGSPVYSAPSAGGQPGPFIPGPSVSPGSAGVGPPPAP